MATPVIPPLPTGSIHGPYEDLGIKTIDLIMEIIKDQPPEVKKQLWDWYIQDMQKWRDGWDRFIAVFQPK